ncbi:MAG: helix-turn-helix domain-containing protein, partial [Gemmataceae bacterium]|nr:helix-turn-helix domain-containing protein [Gemmataceae bacterium]
SQVYRLFDAGELRGHKVGDKRVIDPASVEEYKARHANARPPALPQPWARKSGFRHLKLPRGA